MQRIFCLLLVTIILQNVYSFLLSSNTPYTSSKNKFLVMVCGNTQWDDKTIIAFYRGEELIWHSKRAADGEKFPLVFGIADGKGIALDQEITTGWEDMWCVINSVKSQNRLTVPFVDGVNFRYSPEVFDLYSGRYKFTCDGYVRPNKNVRVFFRFNEYDIAAVVENGQSMVGNSTGLGVSIGSNGNNTAYVTPSAPGNYGKYFCSLRIDPPGGAPFQVRSANTWDAFGSSTVSSSVSTQNYYYSDESPYVAVSCGNSEWNQYTNVMFFSQQTFGTSIIYDSSSADKFPFVNKVIDNTTVVFKKDDFSGYELLSCSVNRTVNVNHLYIPYLKSPTFQYSPRQFRLGQPYVFRCDGYLTQSRYQPSKPITVEFTYNGQSYATLLNKRLTLHNNVPGLTVDQVPISNSSISVLPQHPMTNGTFGCMFSFTTETGPAQTVQAKGWNTASSNNSATHLIAAHTLLIAILAFFIAN